MIVETWPRKIIGFKFFATLTKKLFISYVSILCCDPIFVLSDWASQEKLCQPNQPVQNTAATRCVLYRRGKRGLWGPTHAWDNDYKKMFKHVYNTWLWNISPALGAQRFLLMFLFRTQFWTYSLPHRSNSSQRVQTEKPLPFSTPDSLGIQVSKCRGFTSNV